MKNLFLTLTALFTFGIANAQTSDIYTINDMGYYVVQGDHNDPTYTRVVTFGDVIVNDLGLKTNPQFRVYTQGTGDSTFFNYYFLIGENTGQNDVTVNLNYITQDENGNTLTTGVVTGSVEAGSKQFYFSGGIDGIFTAKYLYIQVKTSNGQYVAKFDLSTADNENNVASVVSALAEINRDNVANPFDTNSDNPFKG